MSFPQAVGSVVSERTEPFDRGYFDLEGHRLLAMSCLMSAVRAVAKAVDIAVDDPRGKSVLKAAAQEMSWLEGRTLGPVSASRCVASLAVDIDGQWSHDNVGIEGLVRQVKADPKAVLALMQRALRHMGHTQSPSDFEGLGDESALDAQAALDAQGDGDEEIESERDVESDHVATYRGMAQSH